jgi:hypothetical protein
LKEDEEGPEPIFSQPKSNFDKLREKYKDNSDIALLSRGYRIE